MMDMGGEVFGGCRGRDHNVGSGVCIVIQGDFVLIVSLDTADSMGRGCTLTKTILVFVILSHFSLTILQPLQITNDPLQSPDFLTTRHIPYLIGPLALPTRSRRFHTLRFSFIKRNSPSRSSGCIRSRSSPRADRVRP